MRYLALLLTSVLVSVILCVQYESVAGNARRDNSGQTGEQKLIQKILDATEPTEAAANYAELFKQIGIDGTRRLQTSPHDTIALQAAWSGCLHSPRRKVQGEPAVST